MKKLFLFASVLVAGMLALTSCGDDKKDDMDLTKLLNHRFICDINKGQVPARYYIFFKSENDYEGGEELFSEPERENMIERTFYDGSFDLSTDHFTLVANFRTHEENGELVKKDTLNIMPIDIHYLYENDTLNLTVYKGEENEETYKFWIPQELVDKAADEAGDLLEGLE